MSHYLEIKSLTFSREEKVILDDISLHVERGESLAIMGESGGGKTTLLRLIAGLEKIQKGEVNLDGKTIASTAHHTPPQKRNIGFVFQQPSLFPHLTVAKNIAFGVPHMAKKECLELVEEYAQKVGVMTLLASYPDELSGGQQQRVALARALICKPRLLLLDEPFSSLDKEARASLRSDVKQLLKGEGMTSIIVTHDEQEGDDFSTRLLMLRRKKLA